MLPLQERCAPLAGSSNSHASGNLNVQTICACPPWVMLRGTWLLSRDWLAGLRKAPAIVRAHYQRMLLEWTAGRPCQILLSACS